MGTDDYESILNAVFVAKLTAMTTVGGVNYYDWTEQSFDVASGSYQNATPPRSGTGSTSPRVAPAREINNASVSVPTLVWLKLKGMVGGTPEYTFVAPGASSGSSSLTVADINPTGTSVANVATLNADQTSGLYVTSPGANQATVLAYAATTSQAGAVSTSTQTFAGIKNFQTALLNWNSTNGGLGFNPNGSSGIGTYNSLTFNGLGGNASTVENQLICWSSTAAAGAGFAFDVSNNQVVLTNLAGTTVALCAQDGAGTRKVGASGTDTVGSVFYGGICTTVGAGSLSVNGNTPPITIQGSGGITVTGSGVNPITVSGAGLSTTISYTKAGGSTGTLTFTNGILTGTT